MLATEDSWSMAGDTLRNREHFPQTYESLGSAFSTTTYKTESSFISSIHDTTGLLQSDALTTSQGQEPRRVPAQHTRKTYSLSVQLPRLTLNHTQREHSLNGLTLDAPCISMELGSWEHDWDFPLPDFPTKIMLTVQSEPQTQVLG